jgi:hypothetical protein
VQVEAEEVPDVAERMDVAAVPFFTFHQVPRIVLCSRPARLAEGSGRSFASRTSMVALASVCLHLSMDE